MIILRFIIAVLVLNTLGNSQQRKIKLDIMDKNDISLNYLFYLPEDYKDDKEKKWPMILFLHGMGERGDDLELVKIHGIPKIVNSKKDFSFIAVSPQCPIEFVWRDKEMLIALESLLLKLVKNFRIDKSRVYATGLSMGGRGTWAIAAYRPDLFAAAAPICGGADLELLKNALDVPFWIFHGDADSVVPVEYSQNAFKLLVSKNNKHRYTEYKDVNHNSWDYVFKEEDYFKWMFSKSK